MQQTFLATISEAIGVEPRPYQTRIIDKVVSIFLGNHKNGAGPLSPAPEWPESDQERYCS